MALPLSVGKMLLVKPLPVPQSKAIASSLGENGKPHARSGHCCVADNSNLYVLGGIFYTPDQIWQHTMAHIFAQESEHDYDPLFRELWKYNFAKRQWSLVEMHGEVPHLTASMSALLSGDHIITFGGSGFPFGARSSNAIHMFNLKNSTWRKLACSGELPNGKYGQTMALIDQHLYVFAGVRKSDSGSFDFDSDLNRLDLKTNHWVRLVADNTPPNLDQTGEMFPLPRGSYRHQMAWDERNLYVIGGGTQWKTVLPLHKLHTYRIDKNQWDLVQTNPDLNAIEDNQGFPHPRKYHTCVQYGTDVYITGGHNGVRVFTDIWKLSIDSFEWKKLSMNLYEPLFFHAAAMTPAGCMYIYGGVTNINNSHRTSETCGAWVHVPSLTEICWNLLLFCMPHIHRMPPEQLAAMGIPRYLLQRLD